MIRRFLAFLGLLTFGLACYATGAYSALSRPLAPAVVDNITALTPDEERSLRTLLRAAR